MCVKDWAVEEDTMYLDDDSSVRVVDLGRTSRPKWMRYAFGWGRSEPRKAMRTNVLQELGNAIKTSRTRTHLNNHLTVI